jgi:hypothetical protein
LNQRNSRGAAYNQPTGVVTRAKSSNTGTIGVRVPSETHTARFG